MAKIYVTKSVISNVIAYNGDSVNITAATMKIPGTVTIPANSDIRYYLSNDNGDTWTRVELDQKYVFTATGQKLLYKITFGRTDGTANPSVEEPIHVEYEEG